MQENVSSLKESFIKLNTIMDELREKCPWDQKQTIQSLRPMTIEETYELGDAVLKEEWKSINSYHPVKSTSRSGSSISTKK